MADSSGTAADFDDDHDQHTDPQRQPGRLHALADRGGPITGAEMAGRPCRRAIGQEGALRGHQPQDESADRQSGQRERPEAADDGEIEKQIDRLGGEHAERRQRQGGNGATGGDPGGGPESSAAFSQERCTAP